MKTFALILSLAVTAAAMADVQDRLYDFTDAYYLQNGVDPALIGGRRQADGINAVFSDPVRSGQRNVRVLGTTGGLTDNGSPAFLAVMGGLSANAFTNNSAGRNARQVADRYAEYIFPSLGGNPTGLGGARQPVIVDRSGGFFSANKLGLWIHVFVNYTPSALKSPLGISKLRDLARKNGTALDGTPIIKTKSEILNLQQQGLVTLSTLPLDNGLRYAICPVIEDPTDGGIAPDQFLRTTLRPDGQPLIRDILNAFTSLQQTGDWN